MSKESLGEWNHRLGTFVEKDMRKEKMTYEQNLLLDCWLQWSYINPDTNRRLPGGLSILEDIEEYLLDKNLIDDMGMPTPKTERKLPKEFKTTVFHSKGK